MNREYRPTPIFSISWEALKETIRNISGYWLKHPLFGLSLEKSARDKQPKIPPFPRKREHASMWTLFMSSAWGMGCGYIVAVTNISRK